MVEEMAVIFESIRDSGSRNSKLTSAIEKLREELEIAVEEPSLPITMIRRQMAREGVPPDRLEEFKRTLEPDRFDMPGFRTLAKQQEIVSKCLSEFDVEDDNDQAVINEYFRTLLVRYGPIRLFRSPIFQETMKIPPATFDRAVGRVQPNSFMAEVSRSKQTAMRAYFEALTGEQLNKLCRRLGIDSSQLDRIGTKTSARLLQKVFSNEKNAYTVVAWKSEVSIVDGQIQKILDSIHEKLHESRGELRAEIESLREFIAATPPQALPTPNTIEQRFLTLSDQLADEAEPSLADSLQDCFDRLTRRQQTAEDAALSEFALLAEVPIRFHVVEIDPQGHAVSEDLQSLFAASARHRRFPLMNSFVPSQLPAQLSDAEILLLSYQWRDLVNLDAAWEEQARDSESILALVECNNRLIQSLNDHLLPLQSVSVFQVFFCAHGPHQFFQRPDVIRDFSITSQQISGMRLMADEFGSVEESVQNSAANILHELFEDFTNAERQRLERVLGCTTQEIVDLLSTEFDEFQMEDMLRRDGTISYSPIKQRHEMIN